MNQNRPSVKLQLNQNRPSVKLQLISYTIQNNGISQKPQSGRAGSIKVPIRHRHPMGAILTIPLSNQSGPLGQVGCPVRPGWARSLGPGLVGPGWAPAEPGGAFIDTLP